MQLLLAINARTDPIARETPFRPEEECVFIVHEKSLSAAEDILSDGNGKWTAGSGAKSFYFVYREGEVKAVSREEYEEEEEEGRYHFTRQIWTCGSAEDFKRVYIRAKDECWDYSLLQYYFTGVVHSSEPARHGNRKSGTASYSRTFQSVRNSLKLQDRETALTSFKHDHESILTIFNPASIPNSKKQIRNMTQESQPRDDIAGLQEKCKKEAEYSSVRFILEITPVPSLFISLATKRQLSDLARFCTDAHRFSVLGIDTLFNVGEFYVTAVTYRHLMLKSDSAHIGTHPVMLGNNDFE